MMRVEEKPEPGDFDELVREPGKAYLATLLTGEDPEFDKRNYWRFCRGELRTAYDAICAYTSFHVPPVTGSETVEHFKPKKLYPNLAYEWSNYRFVCGRMNGRKGIKTDLLDPFHMSDDLFFLGIPSMLIIINEDKTSYLKKKAMRTIDALGLNDELCVPHRMQWMKDFAIRAITFEYLGTHAPFLASEIRRQRLTAPSLRKILFS